MSILLLALSVGILAAVLLAFLFYCVGRFLLYFSNRGHPNNDRKNYYAELSWGGHVSLLIGGMVATLTFCIYSFVIGGLLTGIGLTILYCINPVYVGF